MHTTVYTQNNKNDTYNTRFIWNNSTVGKICMTYAFAVNSIILQFQTFL